MAIEQTRTVGEDFPDDPEDLLPEDSILGLDEYLAMHAAVGHRTLHYHLDKLVDVRLIEKRQRTERGQDGLYTYYRATVFCEVTLTEGVDELIRGEQSFEKMYDSSVES